MQVVVVDPAELQLVNGELTHQGAAIDLVYNRLTDFYFEKPTHALLRVAYLTDAAVFTPTPRNHALYADKRRLTVLSNARALRELGADSDTIDTLVQGVPHTELVQAADAAMWWAQRKQWFFKPIQGFGSRGVYRGEKLTRGVFEARLGGGYVAQALVPPSERLHPVSMPGALKVDVRNFVYGGHVQLIATRLYKGQTTNFRTPGGGFAPVFLAPSKPSAMPMTTPLPSSHPMSQITVYHNPECETSRNTLALIRNSGVEPEVIEYLKTPPGRQKLAALIHAMGVPVRNVLRRKGTPYDELKLDEPSWTDDQLIDFMVEHPILMNRPIVVTPLGTKLCRPSEAVLDILPGPQLAPFTKEDGDQVIDSEGRRVVR